jgi:translocation and assembly module TamA
MLTALLALGLAALAASGARAADPQPYTVTISPTGMDALDSALQASALLLSLKDSAPVPPFGLIERAREDVPRLLTALHSFGYYQGTLMITVAGRRLDDPDLPTILDMTAQGQSASVNVQIATGPLYHLRDITIEGNLPQAARDALMLSSGDPALAADVNAARTRLLTALEEDGYPLAKVQPPLAVADDPAHVLDVTFKTDAGPRAFIGAIAFDGLMSANESFARRVLTTHTGDLYQPSRLEASRQALINTGVFAGVSIRKPDRVSADGRIPITFDVQERPLHAVKLAGVYSTDLGVMLSAGWSDRNLFGNAEQLNLLASGTGLWGNATRDVGYDVSAQFIRPVFFRPNQVFEFGLKAVKQDLQAYNQRLESAGGAISRKFSNRWKASAGITLTYDDVSQQGMGRNYELVSFPVTGAYDSTGLTDPLRDPTRGLRVSLALTPTQAFGRSSLTFFILQAGASSYFDLTGDGRTVLATRALVGSVLGASNFDLPPDQRLYAGGSPTVRGYRYQSIGARFPNGDPAGGTAVDAGTIELRQRILGSWGVAAFLDAGQDSAQGVPFTGTLRVGTGGGLRYYTSIGAIRADVAVPLNRFPGSDSLEIYIGLGQAF